MKVFMYNVGMIEPAKIQGEMSRSLYHSPHINRRSRFGQVVDGIILRYDTKPNQYVLTPERLIELKGVVV